MATTPKKIALVAYVPVIHQGYMRLFRELQDTVGGLFLIDRKLVADKFPLRKDIRALNSSEIAMSLRGLGFDFEVQILKKKSDLDILKKFDRLVVAEDEVSRWLVDQYIKEQKINWRPVFLRWDKKSSLQKKQVAHNTEVTTKELHRKLIKEAELEATKSADWWRQIGGLIAKNGKVLLKAHNKHQPSEQQQYIDGDPRGNFHQGEQIELSTALHSEQSLIAQAAKKGISLLGTDLYTTTFPCPTCAKLVANSGIKRVFYKEGYSMVGGEEVMKAKGVELVRVKD